MFGGLLASQRLSPRSAPETVLLMQRQPRKPKVLTKGARASRSPSVS